VYFSLALNSRKLNEFRDALNRGKWGYTVKSTQGRHVPSLFLLTERPVVPISPGDFCNETAASSF